MDISFTQALILSSLGVVAGVINTLAGGGSNLTIPALMVLGMPADIANATNRVGVFLQSIVGIAGFKKKDKLPLDDYKGILTPLLCGALIGSLVASYAPQSLLKYLLLGAMLSVATIVLVRPSVIAPPLDAIPYKVAHRPRSWGWLLLAGFYGGFVQAGVGFILITTFAGALRYSLLASNALKIFATLCFTSIALGVFILNDQIRWIPGLILALGTMLGAYIGVKIALQISQRALKWFLFLMTLAASAAAIWL